MDLNYQQILAEVYEDNARNRLVEQNEYSDEEKEPYEDHDYDVNELPDPEDFNKYHGDRNKPEHVIIPPAKQDAGGKSGVKHDTDVKTIVLNIDGAFRGNIVPASPTNCDGSLAEHQLINQSVFSLNTNTTFVLPTATNPADFVIALNKQYKNISSVKLTSMEFFNCFYTFSAQRGNTTFMYQFAGDPTTVYYAKIPDGAYSSYTDFANDIQTTMNDSNANTSGNTFTVTYSDKQHQLVISCATSGFTINFPTTTNTPTNNGIGYNMGFVNQSYSALTPSSSGYSIVSDTVPDIVQDRYVYLVINDWNLVEHQIYGQTTQSAFAKIQLNGQKYTTIFDNNYSNSSTKEYTFQQPVNLQRLQISMTDTYGNILNMRGATFSMTLELKQVNNSAVYQKLLEL